MITEQQQEEDDDDSLPTWLFTEDKGQKVKVTERSSPFKRTDVETVGRIYRLGYSLSKVLDDLNVRYWTSGGTTLGLLRHGGLIPWDDDMDFCLPEEEVETWIRYAIPTLKSHHGCIVVDSFFGCRMFHEWDSEPFRDNELLNYRYPFVDIFFMSKTRSRYILSRKNARSLWPQEYYPIEDVLRPQRGLFSHFRLPYPNNADSYLSRTYGSDWNILASSPSYCHRTRRSLRVVRVGVEDLT